MLPEKFRGWSGGQPSGKKTEKGVDQEVNPPEKKLKSGLTRRSTLRKKSLKGNWSGGQPSGFFLITLY
jgi:hypothetical protein